MITKEEVAAFVGIDAHASRCSIKAISSDGGELAAVECPLGSGLYEPH